MYDLPQKMQRFLDGDHPIEEIAQRLYDRPFFLYLGRHVGLPVALEGALKLKEISYIPTEAYSAGEMKHGPIALLEEGTPVVVVATRIHVYDKIVSNIQETRARGAHVIAIATDGNEDIQHHADDVIYVPKSPAFLPGGAGHPAAAAARLPDRAATRSQRRSAAQPREDGHGRVATVSRAVCTNARAAGELYRSRCCATAMMRGGIGSPSSTIGDSRIGRIDGQARHHGDAHARGDEALHRRVVVRAEGPSRIDSGRPEGRDDRRGSVVGTESDQRLRCDLVQRGTTADERAVRSHDHDVRIAQQLDRLERGVDDGELDEAEVDRARFDRADDPVVFELLQHHVDLRPPVGERPHDLRQEPRADRLERSDSERARFSGAKRVEVGLRRLEAADDRVGMPEQEDPCLGERHRPRSARPFDETLADDPLEGRDLLADRRLRVAEPLGGSPEGAFLGDRAQGGEVAELDAEPTISIHDHP